MKIRLGFSFHFLKFARSVRQGMMVICCWKKGSYEWSNKETFLPMIINDPIESIYHFI